jgi:lysophospholipase L1-like esterase
MKSYIRFFVTTILIVVSQLSFAETQKNKPIVFEWYGDSTTSGVTFSNGKYSEIPDAEPTTVQYLLNKRFGAGTVTIINRGVAGTTANQLINGTNKYKDNFAKQLSKGTASIVIVNFGINDAYTPNYTPEMFRNDLIDLVNIAEKSGKKIVIETPNPIDNMHNAWLWEFQHQAIVVGERLGILVISQWTEIMKNQDWQSLLGDKIHPTKKGYDVKSAISFNAIAPVVESILKK